MIVLSASILLSLLHYNLFFFFGPINRKKQDAENVPSPSSIDEILKIIVVHVSI